MSINGTYDVLYIKNSDGDYEPIACLTGNGINETSETINTTTRDNAGWQTNLPTNQGYDISFAGEEQQNAIITDKITLYQLAEKKRNRELVEWRIGSGRYIYGSGYIIDLSTDYPENANVTFTGTITGFGKYLNILDTIYDEWALRVTNAGGTVASKNCVLSKIDNSL